MTKRLLDPKKSALLVVDIQQKFVPIVHEAERIIAKTKALIEAAAILNIPIVVSEQYPKGLGRTVDELSEPLPGGTIVCEKTSFGCLGDDHLAKKIRALKRKQIVVCGVETHVCVSQTVHQLLDAGYEVHLIEDALASRDPRNIEIGVRKMEQTGAIPSCVEMAIFEWMGHSKHADFKALQALIK